MNIPCCSSIQCPDGSTASLDYDTPIANLTSELPDQNIFIGLNFGWDNNLPPIGSNWTANSCLGVCNSLISQQDANDCAARNNLLCLLDHGWGTPPPTLDNGGPNSGPPLILPPNNPGTRYFNQSQTCSVICPDGLPFSWTIGDGYVVATTPLAANQIAFSLACRYAAANMICMGPLDRFVCANVAYNSRFTTQTNHGPVTFSVVSGSMPPGLSPQTGIDGKTLILSGTPTTPGNYVFQLRATDVNGNFMQKTFEIDVLGITNINPLPGAVEHTFYSTQLNATGGVGTLVFSLVSGNLPGLTLSSSGLLSGTPDYVTAGDYPFQVSVTDLTSGLTCTQNGTLHVSLRPGPDWTKLVWTSYPLTQNPPNATASGSGVKNTATANLQTDGTFNPLIRGVAASGVIYTGPSVTCRIRLTLSTSVPAINNSEACRVLKNGGNIPASNYASGFVSGVYTFDFPTGVSNNDAFSIDDASPGNNWASLFGGVAGNLTFSWAIFNL